jgi:hypothetical protein
MRSPTRSPTAAERRVLRRLKDKAGGEAELHRWVTLACEEPKPKRGRRRGTGSPPIDQFISLEGIAAWCREHEPMSRHEAIRWLVDDLLGKTDARTRGGGTNKSMAARLYRKVKDAGLF